ncbi:MAG: bis(5'-nucleosyl)-tetraphosphatase (symmetrical) YqeK [Paenibacillaceae bacterium]
MERKGILNSVRDRLPKMRWEHVQGVMETAVILAERFGANPVKADLAAILHDVAKYWPIPQLEQVVIEHNIQGDLLRYDRQLLHAHVGAYVAEAEYGILDLEILDAIRYHTSGREHMTILDKVVCLADYMEPGRDFPGVGEIRKLAESSLDQALIAGFDSTITYLIAKGKSIYPLTIIARNSLIESL